MITQTLTALTSLSTRLAAGGAAVALSTAMLMGVADLAAVDHSTVVLERVVIEAHRELPQRLDVAQNTPRQCGVQHC